MSVTLEPGIPHTFREISEIENVHVSTVQRACARVFKALRGEEAVLPELKPALDKLVTGVKQAGKIHRKSRRYMRD